MAVIISIRNFRTGEEAMLRAVFFSSVHEQAKSFYSPEQLNVWAPRDYDKARWSERLRHNQPFIAEVDGQVAGFADLQPFGYIDQFFVAGAYAGRGAGKALMEHIHSTAQRQHITELSANVSLAAEPFFLRHGFVIDKRQSVNVAGVVLMNARMRKPLPHQ